MSVLPSVRSPLFAALLLALAPSPSALGQCWSLTTEISNPTTNLTGGYGEAVALSGDRALVGARNVTGAAAWSGAAYLFERDVGGAGAWGQVKKLFAPDGTSNDEFGRAVSLDGDTAAIGDMARAFGADPWAGAVFVFTRDQGGPGAWGLVKRVEAPVPEPYEYFGSALALDGDTLVVGAYGHDEGALQAGTAYVFSRDQGGPDNWGLVAELAPPPPTGHGSAGISVGVSGATAVVGDRGWSSSTQGVAFVYERDLGGPAAWGLAKQLLPSDGNPTNRFGAAVDVHADTIVVGDPFHLHGTKSGGAAYVFERDHGGPGAWGETAELLAPGPANGDALGAALSIDGNTALIGAPGDKSLGPNAGTAYTFERNLGGLGGWGVAQEVVSYSFVDAQDQYGKTLSLSGNTLLVGTIDNGPQQGQAYLWDAPPTTSYCTAGTTANGCQATMVAAGHARRSLPSGFEVNVVGVEGNKKGLIYFGVTGPKATPWGAGTSYRCVQGPHLRTPAQASGGTAGACDGSFFLDFNAWMAAHPNLEPLAGDDVWMQTWFRDPPSPLTTSFSDALHFTVCP